MSNSFFNARNFEIFSVESSDFSQYHGAGGPIQGYYYLKVDTNVSENNFLRDAKFGFKVHKSIGIAFRGMTLELVIVDWL